MAIEQTGNQESVEIETSTEVIPFNYPFWAASDLVVVKTEGASGADTVLTLNTHYTVSVWNGDSASVTLLPGAGEDGDRVTVYREIPYKQTTVLREGDPLPAKVLEERLDRLTVQIQQVKALVDRALRVKETSPLVPAADIKDPTKRFLAFDAGSNLVAMTGSEATSLLNLPETIVDYPTKTWADDDARGDAAPDFVGQVGVQLDTYNVYISTGTNPGDWDPFVQNGALVAANNLSDVANAGTARGNLGADDAANLSTGTLPDARLSGNVAMTNASETFTANLIVQGQAYSEAHSLADASTIATDCDNGNVFVVTLGGNRTLGAPSNLKNGATYIWIIKQDATGSRTLSFNSVFKFPNGAAATLSTGADQVDLICAVSDGTYLYSVAQLNLS